MSRWLSGLAICLAMVVASAPCQAGEFTVVVHAGVPIDTASATDIKKILTGQVRTWSDGQPIVLVLPPKASPALAWACKDLLKISPMVYLRYVSEKVFRGALDEPTRVDGDAATPAAVGLAPGAIGVTTTAAVVEGVKAISVQ